MWTSDHWDIFWDHTYCWHIASFLKKQEPDLPNYIRQHLWGDNCNFCGQEISNTYYMAESLSSYSYPLDTAFLTPRSCQRALSALYTGVIMLCRLSKQQVQVRITCACCWKWKIKYAISQLYRDIQNKDREIFKSRYVD